VSKLESNSATLDIGDFLGVSPPLDLGHVGSNFCPRAYHSAPAETATARQEITNDATDTLTFKHG
jgi:hypothetical protein